MTLDNQAPVTVVTEVIEGASQRPVTVPADQLARLAARVARLAPSHRDPERFHEEKSEIAADLRRLARERRT